MAGLAVAAAAWGGFPRWSGAQPPAKRVLIIHSFGHDFAPYDVAIASVRRELASISAEPVIFVEAAFNAARVIGPGEEAAFVAYLATRFSQPTPDLMVSVAEPTAQFLVRHRDTLFTGMPILLTALDVRAAPRVVLQPGDAVIAVQIDVRRAFDAILRVLTKTRTIAVVLGDTPLERFWRKEVERDAAYLADRVRFVWFDGLSLAQIKERVAALSPDSDVFYGLMVVDAAGIPYERLDALAELRRSAKVPIFSVFENELGQGVVGGPYLLPTRVGLETARIAQRQLSASPTAAPEFLTFGMDTVAYDAHELQPWHIDEPRLPPASEVRFREPSLWIEHRKEIVVAAAVITAQAALIAALLAQRARKQRVERDARPLGGRLITACEDERRRMARELHDDVTQRLAGVSIEAATLSRLDDAAARQAAEQSDSGELAALSRDVQALSYRRHPTVVDDLGLSEALRIECERSGRRSAIEVAFDGDEAGNAIRGDRALGLFRVAQEALRNALRRERPRHIRVELGAAHGGTSLAVVDDGVGFEPEAQRDHASLGLASMRGRVALLGGRLEVRSQPGRGTSVTAWVPAA